MKMFAAVEGSTRTGKCSEFRGRSKQINKLGNT